MRPICYWPKRWQRRLGCIAILPVAVLVFAAESLLSSVVESWREVTQVWNLREPHK